MEKVEGSFRSSGFIKAEKAPARVNLAMGKQWARSLITFAFLKGDGITRAEIDKILDEVFTRVDDKKAPFLFPLFPFLRGSKSTIFVFVFEEPSDFEWILSEAKRKKFMGKSYIVSWVIDLKTGTLHKNKGLPKIAGIGEQEVKKALLQHC